MRSSVFYLGHSDTKQGQNVDTPRKKCTTITNHSRSTDYNSELISDIEIFISIPFEPNDKLKQTSVKKKKKKKKTGFEPKWPWGVHSSANCLGIQP